MLSPEDAENLCMCAYAHDTLSPEDNHELSKGCDRYLENVVLPRLREAWHEGWFSATNGKWGLPDKGECPYGDQED